MVVFINVSCTEEGCMSDDVLLNAAALAARLGLTKSSVYRLAAARKIPTYMAGAKLTGRRFDLAEVKAALRLPASHEVSK
jgi:excisionase family DNA binding protein